VSGKTWKYAVAFGNEGDRIEFIHQSRTVTFVEELISSPPMELILLRGWNPIGWKIWSAVLNWVHSKEVKVYSIPATPEMLQALVPTDEWLWEDEGL
jgi:hypothetical protein